MVRVESEMNIIDNLMTQNINLDQVCPEPILAGR